MPPASPAVRASAVRAPDVRSPDVRSPDVLSVSIQTVDASDEQAWNDAVFDPGPILAPLLRLWCYRAPAVVLGRSQQALARKAPALASPLARIERRAGGGAVLVGPWMVGMSLVLPVDHPWIAGRSIAASYEPLGRAWTAALASLGATAAPASEADARKAPAELAWACFAGVTAHEVLVGRRKIVGLAQRRHRHGVLLVAGVLVEPVPWELLAAVMLPLVGGGRAEAGGADAASLAESRRGLAAETVSIVEASGRPLTAAEAAPVCRDHLVAALDAAALDAAADAGAARPRHDGEGRS